jgi:hypothetical protein
MGVFVSNWYFIILIVWGLIFEVGGVIAFWLLYRATVRDQRNHNLEADVWTRYQAATPVSVPAEAPAETPRHRRAA